MARLVDTLLAYDVQVYNSYNPIWIASRMTYYCCSNFCRAFAVRSLTVSLISCKSPSVNVVGTSDVFVGFDFFLDPPFSSSLGHLMKVDIF